MNQVFLILAHKNPEQLLLLLKQLQHEQSFFFIHIDGKSNLYQFEQGTRGLKNVHYIKKRHNVKWGTYSIVKATLSLIDGLIESDLQYSHAHLLSGEDISLRPVDDLIKFFSSHSEKCFMEFFKLPHKNWIHEGMDRVTRYNVGKDVKGININAQRVLYKIDWLVNDVLIKILPFLQKKIPDKLQLYGGSAWWSLNRSSIEWLKDHMRFNKKIIRFYKTAHFPDELFFQTILLNSEFSSCIDADHKRFIDWNKSVNGGPTLLNYTYYDTLINSMCFFARKVDVITGRELYNLFPIQNES